MKKQPEITDKTRQQFVKVFCELYSKKPIEKISIQEIANKSGYNRSTFYQYFSDIYELLDYVESNLIHSIKEEISNRESPKHTIEQALHCLENNQEITIMKALFGDYGSVRTMQRMRKELPFDRLIFDFPTDTSISPYLIEFYLSTYITVFRLWIQNNKDLSSEELFNLVNTLYLNGIMPYTKNS